MDMPGHEVDFSEREEDPAPPPVPPETRGLSLLDWSALIAVVAGGLNSGLIAAVDLDVFAKVLPSAAATRGVYGLIGLAALYSVVLLFRLGEQEADSHPDQQAGQAPD
ncbi:DUF378 domain-containing protein [Achromobacter xylosoxidans]|uniref:DUF378 domain-containing protein n=1 Tax=Alcaligenes xylosoxydans xylosoxydans TaxID=85698 RepID=UPI000B4912AC|nr:DUF378 domain-containing protein [Achromobacter xylosoxidans]